MSLVCSACTSAPPPALGPQLDSAQRAAHFSVPDKSTSFSSLSALQAFEAEVEPEYRLGPGDEVDVYVAARSELSGKQTVGPDGRLSLPLIGGIEVRDVSREVAANRVRQALSRYYVDPFVSITVTRYTSNRVVVLGRVENPGTIQFEANPTLIEVLSRAGGFPILRPEQVLTRCAVIRGEKILWVDLKALLNGNMALNLRLRRGDTVYIPDAYDTTVYVLGAVNKPGVYRLTPKMSFLDALGQAGGPSMHASASQIRVIRPSQKLDVTVDLAQLLTPNPSLNVALEEGDVLYVPYSWVAEVGYVLDQINPFATLFSIRQLSTPSSSGQ